MYSVIDCNSFYVSCERVFQPKYNNHPVVVLSNNDGCVISRSIEAKQMGIPMGAPAFKYEEFFQQNKVKVFSANFALYGDMSSRVMKTIAEYGQEMEIYSIDEAFLKLQGFSPKQLSETSKDMRAVILKNIGIPVSIGVAQTKTLSKAANEIAKNTEKYQGVYVIDSNDSSTYEKQFAEMPISEIWGIGRRLTAHLNELGVFTIKQLMECDDQWIKDTSTISGLKSVRELRGESCIDFEEVRAAKQSIISSKSFGTPTKTKAGLKEAVASFTARAAEKLREEREITARIGVSITTNYHKKQEQQYHNSKHLKLLQPTDHTPDLITTALQIVDSIYKDGFRYKKATVHLFDLRGKKEVQDGLWYQSEVSWQDSNRKRDERLMHVVDKINTELGTETVRFGAQGVKTVWKQRRMKRSPRYTTRWDELPKVQ